MHGLRRVFFYFFLLLYVVGTPALILYALGYELRPGQEQALVRTGLISLSTTPGGARVFLGNLRYRWKTPTELRGLNAGEYPVRLTLRDHQAWSATVRVEPEKATVLDRILLFPNIWPIRQVTSNRYTTLYPLPGESLFLLAGGPLAGQLELCDTGDRTVTPLLPPDDPWSQTTVTRLHQMADNPCLLLEGVQENQRVLLWRRLDVPKEPTADITTLFPENPKLITWDHRERDDLITLVSDQVNRIDLDDRAFYPALLKGVLSVAAYRGDLLVLDRSNRFFRTSRDGQRKPEILGRSPAEVTPLWENRSGYRIQPLSDEVNLFLGPEGELYVNYQPFELMPRGCRGVLSHPDEKTAIVWEQQRVGRLNFAFADKEKQRLLSSGIEWLHTSETPLDQVFWCHKESHLLLAGAGRMSLLALESAGGPSLRPLIEYEPGTSVFYAEDTGAIYYLERGSRVLMELQLLPRRDLLGWVYGEARDKESPSKP